MNLESNVNLNYKNLDLYEDFYVVFDHLMEITDGMRKYYKKRGRHIPEFVKDTIERTYDELELLKDGFECSSSKEFVLKKI